MPSTPSCGPSVVRALSHVRPRRCLPPGRGDTWSRNAPNAVYISARTVETITVVHNRHRRPYTDVRETLQHRNVCQSKCCSTYSRVIDVGYTTWSLCFVNRVHRANTSISVRSARLALSKIAYRYSCFCFLGPVPSRNPYEHPPNTFRLDARAKDTRFGGPFVFSIVRLFALDSLRGWQGWTEGYSGSKIPSAAAAVVSSRSPRAVRRARGHRGGRGASLVRSRTSRHARRARRGKRSRPRAVTQRARSCGGATHVTRATTHGRCPVVVRTRTGLSPPRASDTFTVVAVAVAAAAIPYDDRVPLRQGRAAVAGSFASLVRTENPLRRSTHGRP